MSDEPRKWHWRRFAKVGLALLILNEIRGVIVVAGILWAWWR